MTITFVARQSLESLALKWVKTNQSVPVEDFLVQEGIGQEHVAGFNGQIHEAVEAARLFCLVKSWYESPAGYAMSLFEFCQESWIPVDETRDDKMTVEVRAALKRMSATY